ncbi:MAG: MaoC/PaaZ C-terminal domain-containing protein [Alphaproteobacteria bacterium]|jgi:acyl dehydratase|nr:MaoC/PaaZ C-terminal domain-containing protein [Alphaproteobacteria bacterium]
MSQVSTPFLLANAHELVGKEIAVTDWLHLDQMQVNIFGEVTRWPYWMHSDPERCAEESPYGGTLVHGFFMVSLMTHFMLLAGIMRPPDAAYSLNYGLDKVRVIRPVLVGDGVWLRDRITLLEVTDLEEGRRRMKVGNLIEVKGEEQPALYGEYLGYWFPKND